MKIILVTMDECCLCLLHKRFTCYDTKLFFLCVFFMYIMLSSHGNEVLPRARYYASHTKTMLPTRKSVPRSSRQSDHMKIS